MPSNSDELFAFCHIEKTAGVTVSRVLRRTFGLAHCDVEPALGYTHEGFFSGADLVYTQSVHPHLRSIAGHCVRPYSDLSRVAPVRYFTFLRDPVERTVSHFQYHLQRLNSQRSFSDWIKDPRQRNLQTRHLAGTDDPESALQLLRDLRMFIGVVDHFDESLNLLSAWMGEPLYCVPGERANTAPSQDVKHSLLDDPANLDLIRDANDADIKLLEGARGIYESQRVIFGSDVSPCRERYGVRARVRYRANRVYRNAVYKPLLRRGRKAHSA